MFLVKDKFKDREERIRQFLDTEPPIAVLLSAIHFEWTVRRGILALGKSSNRKIREKMRNCYGLDKYKELWKEEMCLPFKNIPILAKVVKNWQRFQEDFKVRHRLVHGAESCSKNFASDKVKSILTAADNIRIFCEQKGISLESRLPVKQKDRQ